MPSSTLVVELSAQVVYTPDLGCDVLPPEQHRSAYWKVARATNTEQYMKATVSSCFSFAAALVLSLAASHPLQATQHRDPLTPQEVAHSQASDSTTAKVHSSSKKNAKPSTESKNQKPAKKNPQASAQNAGDSRSHSGSGTGMK